MSSIEREPSASSASTCVSRCVAMVEVLAQLRGRVPHHGSVTRIDRPRRQLQHRVQARSGTWSRSPSGGSMKLVPRPSTASPVNRAPSSRSNSADVIRGVPGRVHRGHLRARPRAARLGRADARRRRAGTRARVRSTISANERAPGAWSGWSCVTTTCATVPATRATSSRCAGSSGPGSITIDGSRPTTQVFVPSSVYTPGFGARTLTIGQHQSCSMTERGSVAISSVDGSRVSTREPTIAPTSSHPARCRIVSHVGQ